MSLRRLPLALLALCLSLPAWSLDLTGITFFAVHPLGNQIEAGRWNSGPKDAAWDLFLYEGDTVRGTGGGWLNDPDTHQLRVPLSPGEHAFTFHLDAAGGFERYGMNLFFGEEAPGISVRATTAGEGFEANGAGATMGPNITTVPAAGRASLRPARSSLWRFEPRAGLRCTVTRFDVLTPEEAGVDLVGPDSTAPSGRRDLVVQFALRVEEDTDAPLDWLLWTGAVAGVDIAEDTDMTAWREQFGFDGARPPFSFSLGGVVNPFLEGWTFSETHAARDGVRTDHVLAWRDPATGLELRWEGVSYGDYPVVEWTVWLENRGTADTPVIEGLRGLDIHLEQPGARGFALHHWKGTMVAKEDFAPELTVLDPGTTLDLRPSGGRATGGNWPYFNLRAGDEGILFAVSWAGRWYTTFTRDDGTGLAIAAGQEDCHFVLRPGEKVRTPLIAMLFTDGGDWVDAQNLWRRWMVALNVPRSHGELPPLPLLGACSSHQFAEMTKADEQSQKDFIDDYLEKGFKLDYWWMDAGWYVHAAEDGWPKTGTWEVDRRPHRFPNGLRAVSDHARAKGVKTIVWFEPERVHAGTWLADERTDWVIGGKEGGLLDLGDPAAWQWAVEHFSGLIESEGIDLYRQDYNIDPLPFWQRKDTEDRRGITENKYVQGYLAYWDALLERHPGLMIDSCASGGHRNDLETMRRAIPMLRSDYLFEPVGQQGHTYGLASWLPFFGTGYCPANQGGWGWGSGSGDLTYAPYPRRSNMCPGNIGCFDFRVAVDDALLMKLYREWVEVAPAYFGDYYPLTPYSLDADQWIAWQFNRGDAGDGFVQAFRRDACRYTAARLPLRGLDPDATYRVKDYDVDGAQRFTGRELMEEGLPVSIPALPGAVTVRYVRE